MLVFPVKSQPSKKKGKKKANWGTGEKSQGLLLGWSKEPEVTPHESDDIQTFLSQKVSEKGSGASNGGGGATKFRVGLTIKQSPAGGTQIDREKARRSWGGGIQTFN